MRPVTSKKCAFLWTHMRNPSKGGNCPRITNFWNFGELFAAFLPLCPDSGAFGTGPEGSFMNASIASRLCQLQQWSPSTAPSVYTVFAQMHWIEDGGTLDKATLESSAPGPRLT